MPSTEKLCSIVDNISTKIALATSKNINDLLAEYLPKLIQLLVYPDDTVIGSLTQISRRIKTEDINLPVDKLLELYTSGKINIPPIIIAESDSPFLKNFSKLFFEIAWKRSSEAEKGKLFSIMFLKLKNDNSDSILLRFILEVLQYTKSMDEIKHHEEKKNILLNYFQDLLLCQHNFSVEKLVIPEGLSLSSLKTIVGNGLTNTELIKFKMEIVDFNEIYPHLLVATCDEKDSIASTATTLIRKLDGLNLDDKNLISNLYELYLGRKDRSKPSEKLKIKILTQFLTSEVSANLFPQTKEIIIDSFISETSSQKLKNVGMQFFLFVIEKGKEIEKYSNEFFDSLFNYFTKVLKNDLKDENIYLILGSLCKKFPNLVKKKVYLLKMYFEMLSKESPKVKMIIQQGLSSLMLAYEQSKELEDILLEVLNVYKTDHYCKYSAIQGANRIFPFHHIPSRYMCIISIGDSNLNVREESFRGTSTERFSKYRQNESSDIDINVYPDFIEMLNYVVEKKEKLSDESNVSLILFLKNCLTNYESKQLDDSIVSNYLELLINTLNEKSNNTLQFEASSSLLSFISKDYSKYIPFISKYFSKLKLFIYMGDEYSREKFSKLISTLYFYQDDSEVFLNELKDNIKNKSESMMHGALLTFGNITSLYFKKYSKVMDSYDEEYFISLLDHHKPLVAYASCYTFGEVGKYGKFSNTKHIIEILKKKLNSKGIETKYQEKILTTLGYISLNEGLESDELISILDVFFELSDNKAEEVHFTIGESLSMLCGGFQYSNVSKDELYYFEKNEKELKENEFLTFTLKKLIKEGVLSPKRIVRFSTSIWLLTLIKHCSNHPDLLKYMNDLQKSFQILLSDINPITQEVASKGLTMLYEMGSEQVKNELVNSLIDSLSGNKKNSEMKSQELLLFPEKSNLDGSGGNTSSYQELVSVVNDIGKPELIYKFLSISNHHTLWNTKKAAAFSATSIFKETKNEKEIEEMLPTLVPKLFRYIFDPNPMISSSMREMWKSLVSNPKKTVDQYLKEIMKELTSNITSNLWRVRQACCDALSDIYSGRRFEEMEEFIEITLEKLFRVSDDVKETSQKSAVQCLKGLTNFLSKCCNPIYTPKEQVDRALKLILNLFLEKGILFPTDFIRGYSLENIQSIVKVTKSHIRPHISNIISTLLQQMSVLEPAQFNYIQNMSGGDGSNEHRELTAQLERLRVQMASTGPISEIIVNCQNFINDDVMKDLVPKLIEIMKSGVGLPTRIGCAKLLGELAKFHGNGMKPYVKQLIKMILNTIKSTSVSSSEKSSLAKTLPDLIKLGKTSDGKLMISEIVLMYQNNSDDPEIQYTSGVITLYLSQNVLGIVTHFFNVILPTIFIGRHDDNEKVSQIWKEVWSEVSTAGSKSLLLKYLEDIVKECQKLMDHSSWKMKKQGALGFKEIAETLEQEMELDMRENLIEFLIKKLISKTWEGKEVVLDAIGSLSNYNEHKNIKPEYIMNSLLKESKKLKNMNYVLHAIKALEKCSRGKNDEFFDSFIEFVKEKLSVEELKFEEDVKLDQKRADQKIFFESRRILVKCFSKILPTDEKKGIEFYLSLMLEQSKKTILFSERIEMLNVIETFSQSFDNKQQLIDLAFESLFENMEYTKPNEVKIRAAEVVENLLRKNMSTQKYRELIDDIIQNEKDKLVKDKFEKLK